MTDLTKKTVHNDALGKTYTLPEIYDIAFDFRDVAKEVDFLVQIARRHGGREITSVMEMACGPAYHTREMARRGLVSDGLDLEPAMVAYTRKLIDKENLAARIFEGDMKSFVAKRKYDLVYCLMASFAQLETNDDIIAHFNCVADMLTDGGIYIISTAHPRDFYGEEDPSAKTYWEMSRGDITVTTSWGGSEQRFDPLTEVDDILVSFEVTTGGETTRYEFPDRYRRCSFLTFDALVKLSGRFSAVDYYGDFDVDRKLSNNRSCWRFIPVLKKVR